MPRKCRRKDRHKNSANDRVIPHKRTRRSGRALKETLVWSWHIRIHCVLYVHEFMQLCNIWTTALALIELFVRRCVTTAEVMKCHMRDVTDEWEVGTKVSWHIINQHPKQLLRVCRENVDNICYNDRTWYGFEICFY